MKRLIFIPLLFLAMGLSAQNLVKIQRSGVNNSRTESRINLAIDQVNDNADTATAQRTDINLARGKIDSSKAVWDYENLTIDRSISTDSTITADSAVLGGLYYSDSYWDDLRVPLTNTKINPLLSEPVFEDAGNGVFAFGFDADADSAEVLNFTTQMPHSWKLTTAIDAHLHWMPSTTNTGNVLWKMKLQVAPINNDWAVIDSFYVLDAGDGTAYKHQLLDLGDVPGDSLGSTVSTIISGSLSRVGEDATDTYTGSAYGLEIDFHYEIDAPGSPEETNK